MKSISDFQLGFADAVNYQRRENKDLFNIIFVKNIFLDILCSPSTYFLIGEKGTGKTAYAVFLANNVFKENVSELKYIEETDYQKFVTLKQEKHLQLSDYTSIWKVIILLILSRSIKNEELVNSPFTKIFRIKALNQAIDDYYANAFSPEIIYALKFVEDSKVTAELIAKYLRLGGDKSLTTSFQESRFQVNLLYIQNQFENALADLKLKHNHLLFIDGIDIRPGLIPYQEYLDCIKGLASAVWSLNNDFLSQIKGSKGRFRAILLMRPDIFNSLGLHNSTNKIRDNSVYLDWRTNYPNHRNSQLFLLSDRLLASQQETELEVGSAWDYYFPWKSKSRKPNRDYDPPFIDFLRLSYSRPRDIITIIQLLQEEHKEKQSEPTLTFTEDLLSSSDFQTKYSEYLMGAIKDQLSFYYNISDYNIFLRFFSFLNGRIDFNYFQYNQTYMKLIKYIENNQIEMVCPPKRSPVLMLDWN
ncbi:MAG: funZ protein [Deltaproteobacteria bacterium]|nr:funZ protein [Deltaproteobacteria bacterium]